MAIYFDGFDTNVCITNFNSSKIAIGYAYDRKPNNNFYHIGKIEKIIVITGDFCSKCKALEKMINSYNLERFFSFEPIDKHKSWIYNKRISSVPILKFDNWYYETNYSEILRFVKWLKDNT